MKGDATTHTTNAKYRAGYDAIIWDKRKPVPFMIARDPGAPLKTNGGIVCDMDRGPCACGATHGM
jgi:hypothetical protein